MACTLKVILMSVQYNFADRLGIAQYIYNYNRLEKEIACLEISTEGVQV